MKTKWITLHGQRVRVKVYPPGKAVGASNYSRYHKKNFTGTTLASAQTLSKARFGDRTPDGSEKHPPP